MSLLDVRDRVAVATQECWDEESTLGNLATQYRGGHDHVYGNMTKVARHELLSKVGVPTTYHGKPFFDKLAGETQMAVVWDCIVENDLNYKPILARWTDTTLRAVVSNYYTCVPHLSVIDALIGSDTPFIVRGFWPEPFKPEAKTMHLRLTTPTLHSLNGDSDVGHTMIHISNSEVGRGALLLDVGVWRVVCTNGLMARIGGKMLLKERHIYREPAELIDSFNNAVAQAEEVAANYVHVLEWAQRQHVPIERALAILPSERMRELVRERLDSRETLFDLFNAVTSAAQEYTHEAQFRWEKWARELLDRDWADHGHVEGEHCPVCGSVRGSR